MHYPSITTRTKTYLDHGVEVLGFTIYTARLRSACKLREIGRESFGSSILTKASLTF